MQRCILFILIFISSAAVAQKNVADSNRSPAVTDIGKPFGNIASAKISSKGGLLKSPDGKLEIIFPEGALENEVTISIQPVTNELAGDENGAYQLEPSGIRFKKPIQLIFHFAHDENPSSQFIATQNENGQWFQLKKVVINTLQKTVSGFIPHFSSWAVAKRFVLKPGKATVITNRSLNLYIVQYPPPKPEDIVELTEVKINGEVQTDDLVELTEVKINGEIVSGGEDVIGLTDTKINGKSIDEELLEPLKHKYSVQSWSVNDIVKGNGEVGTVDGNKAALYKAPGTVPSQNPVIVAAKIRITTGDKSKTISLTSKIKIIEPGYLFTYIHKNFAGCFHYVDSSSCIIRFDSKSATISDIVNYKPWSDWDPCTKCNHQYTNKESFKANVEIWGMQSSKVIAATEQKPKTEVYVGLLPALGNTPAAEQQCPKSPKIVVPAMPLPAHPKYIHFETDGTDIIVHYLGESGKNSIYKKVKNEETIIKVKRL